MTAQHKILVANRGEIAMRIVQACVKLGLDFVCVHTEEDRHSGHVALARELGGDKSLYRISTYLDANEIFSVADEAGATAVHPGYGFFAENYRFARRVVERDRPLIWIGPNWKVIQTLGDKINTKRIARKLGVPTVPGTDKPVSDEIEAEEIAKNLFAFQADQGIDRPRVLVKASAGGGGMGIEEVNDPDLFRSVFRRIRNYSRRQFADDGVLIEQRINDFNHLEVQVVSDRTGKNPIHFGTRNCSVQSNGHQKRIEVAPGFAPGDLSYTFDAQGVLDEITAHSLAMAREVGYDSVGTWEWIVTRSGRPFLMEVNTRIQVENGVSAIIARIKGEGGVDLLVEQLRLGLGEETGYTQEDVTFEGVGIEYRLIAEDPDANFAPWVGRIEEFSWPTAGADKDQLRVHTQVPVDKAYDIPTEYDPNLALAIVWGENLADVRARGKEFLDKMVLRGSNRQGGLRSNIDFLHRKTDSLLVF